MRINIDITEKMEEIIRNEVKKELMNGGLLRFIRECVNNKVQSIGVAKRLRSIESQLPHIKRKLGMTDEDGSKKQDC